jgi:hypothetical protein
MIHNISGGNDVLLFTGAKRHAAGDSHGMFKILGI